MRPMRYAMYATLVVGAAMPGDSYGQLVIDDKLTGASSSYDWRALNGACLTAGNNTGSIPACVGLPYYGSAIHVGGVTGRLPDAPGYGALRLTNGDIAEKRHGVNTGSGTNAIFQTGAVVSNFTFPTHRGLRVSFTTVTYGGNNLDGHGADGMSFFLADGSRPVDVGAPGGSLGYSCKNLLIGFDRATGSFDAIPGNPLDVPDMYDGVDGGYLGIGIDEYGNFANPADNTDTGPGFKAGRISLRGAGDTRWARLNRDFPHYYPATLSIDKRAEAVRNTCATGKLWNYSGTPVNTNVPLALNYPHLASSDLPPGTTIENQQAIDRPLRGAAVPITYTLDLSQDGYLDFSYSVNGGTPQPVVTGRRITESNGPLPASFRFGFSGSTGGGSNVHEITCFKAAPQSSSSTSAGTDVKPTTRVRAGSQLYLVRNHPLGWWGQLTAHDLLEDTETDTLAIRSAANWDAHCVLTGGACEAMGPAAPTRAAQAPSARTMLSWNGATGVPLRWDSLTEAQRGALSAADGRPAPERLDYLRGSRDAELPRGGRLRGRTGVLGDMQNSSPTWVGAPSSPYDGPWVDAITGAAGPEGQSYAAFRASRASRTPVVYVGANDGLLHGFRAGGTNDGRELLAYMPADVVSRIHSTTAALDYTHPRYAHNLYVDATPGTGDLYFGGAWRTWLVGGLGPARNENGAVGDDRTAVSGTLYALDVTDPAGFAEGRAGAIVKGEWSSASITCVNHASCGAHLGAVVGTPAIRRLHDGSWAALFGNGMNSSAGGAGLFIMRVDSATGAITFRYLDTGAGAEASKNGIANVTPADLDGDHITDYVYAGDRRGNVWRFDLSSADPARWSADAAPLFSAPGQPITGKVAVASVPGRGPGALPRVVVAFGTGEKHEQTLASAATYAAGEQALYGVWDAGFEDWNAKTRTGARYASLTSASTVTPAQLLAQTVGTRTSAEGADVRTVTRAEVCWKGNAACRDGNEHMGWSVPLAAGEQALYNPVLAYGMFLVNTTMPEDANPLTCARREQGGYTMALSVENGGAARTPFFPDAAVPDAAGLALGATGSPSVMTTRRKAYLVQQTHAGGGRVTRIQPAPVGPGGRLNWIQLR